jgi:DNA (cytosine-5)-methyltransferase 1
MPSSLKPAYYNEIDPYVAQWLRNLIDAGYIAPGDVDERSIVDVRPDDLRGYTQCHFFAGIGGWSLALRLAGWSDDRPVWTGSCPCQPFSAAGQGKAFDDARHLWPAWMPLVAERRPPVVLGEQVAAAIGWGWLDAVFADLEAEGYACGAAVLPACGVGAPHIRQRVWFVADHTEPGRQPRGRPGKEGSGIETPRIEPGRLRDAGELADAMPTGWAEGRASAGNGQVAGSGIVGGMGDSDSERETPPRGLPGGPISQRARSPWAEPGTFPLAHGIPGRVGRLRAYGNAIVPQVAAEFIAVCKGERK